MLRKMSLVCILLLWLLLSGTALAASTDITRPGDRIRGVPNDGDWPGNEAPQFAIDDNIGTKYLHFKGDFAPDPGTGGAGFRVTPSTSQTTVVGLTFTTANDIPGRDPIAFELSGSNGSIDGPYSLIARGEITDFGQAMEWPRLTRNETLIWFSNRTAYNHYQLIFTAIRGPVGGMVNSVQIAEVELLGAGMSAFDPAPSDGEIYGGTWASLTWVKGATAASHDVYFGDNLANVEAGARGTYWGNHIETHFDVGLPGRPCPDGLVPGVTYYWRVDEVEANGRTTHKGDVWSFTTAYETAYDPYPPDGARFVDRNVTLSWRGGFNATHHEVYFSDNFDDVNDGLSEALRSSQSSTSFDVGLLYPDGLVQGMTYYWRIDEVEADGAAVHKGDVWSFAVTIPGLGGLRLEKWNSVYGEDLNALKGHWKYPDSPDETRVIAQFDTGANLDENYGGRIHGWLFAPMTGNYTFWICTDDQGELWLSTDGQPQNARLIAYVKDSPTASSGWAPRNMWTKYAWQRSTPVRLVSGNSYYIMALWKEGVGGDHCQVAWKGPGVPEQAIIAGDYLSPEPLGTYPVPADGAKIGDNITVLRWNRRESGIQYDVYVGTVFNNVSKANRWDTSGIYRGRLLDNSYTAEDLVVGRTYFWRIDEVESYGSNIRRGDIWSFTVVDSVTVEYHVSASEDDAYGYGDALQNSGNNYLRVGYSSFSSLPYYMSGMVFRNVDIPQGAEILSAILRIHSYDSRLTDMVCGVIEAEATDNSDALGDSRYIDSMVKTSALVTWDHYEPWTANTWYESPDIGDLVQEVIDRAGWSPNNSLTIIYGTRQDDGGVRHFSSYDRGSEYAPKLEITYAP